MMFIGNKTKEDLTLFSGCIGIATAGAFGMKYGDKLIDIANKCNNKYLRTAGGIFGAILYVGCRGAGIAGTLGAIPTGINSVFGLLLE